MHFNYKKKKRIYLGIMSPAAISDTQSDSTSATDSYNPYFTYNHNNSLPELSMEYTDFQEEELPKNFFNMNKNERLQFAKTKRIDPLLIKYLKKLIGCVGMVATKILNLMKILNVMNECEVSTTS